MRAFNFIFWGVAGISCFPLINLWWLFLLIPLTIFCYAYFEFLIDKHKHEQKD